MDLSTFSNHQKKLSISIPHNVDRSAAAKSTKGEHISGSTTTKDYGKEDCNETRAVCSSSSSSTSQKKAVCRFEYNEERIINSWNGSFVQHEWATLYIQMQLCESTLRQWLDERNTRSGCADVKQSLAIFRQIVCGVEYIHSQGIVHHDIKPSNIFVNKDVSQVQVGDLGLACFFQHTQDVTLMNQSSCSLDHKGEIGTKLYAAPEQLKGECNPKSDIYSLGIVLFELLQPFSTDMERSKLVTQLKAGNIPPELTAMSPQLIQLIETLVSSDTATRPTARDLLASLDSLSSREPSNDTPAVDDADETIRQLRADISRKVHEIEELKRKVQALELCK